MVTTVSSRDASRGPASQPFPPVCTLVSASSAVGDCLQVENGTGITGLEALLELPVFVAVFPLAGDRLRNVSFCLLQ